MRKADITVSRAGAMTVSELAMSGKCAIFIPSPNVDAPIINQYPLTIECKVVSFEDGCLIGEVVNQSADQSILNENGQIDLALLKPIVFDAAGMCYRSLGEVVGKAWDAGKVFMK